MLAAGSTGLWKKISFGIEHPRQGRLQKLSTLVIGSTGMQERIPLREEQWKQWGLQKLSTLVILSTSMKERSQPGEVWKKILTEAKSRAALGDAARHRL